MKKTLNLLVVGSTPTRPTNLFKHLRYTCSLRVADKSLLVPAIVPVSHEFR